MSLATTKRLTKHCRFIIKLKPILTGGLVLLCLFGLWGQRWSKIPKQFTVDDGLPTLDIYDIRQDQDGFLWIGTDVGVARFDGYDFQVLTMRDGLPNNDIIRIQEDRKGRIWLSSIGPPCVIENGVASVVDLPEIKHIKTGFDFHESAEGGFWFNYSSCFHYIDPALESQPTPTQLIDPRTQGIRSVVTAKADTILFYTGEKIYLTYNAEIVDSLALPTAMKDIKDMAYDYTFHGIYFVNYNGLQYWSFQDNKITLLDPEANAGLDLIIENQQLFLLHPNYGLRIYDIDGAKAELYQHFFPSNFCNSYLIDYEGNLWITTLGNGLYFYPRQIVESNATVLPKEHQRINKLQVRGNQLLLGTYNGRIYTYAPSDRETKLWIESSAPKNDIFDRIMDIVELEDGTTLLGKDTGLYELEKDSLRKLTTTAIKALNLGPSGNLLINTPGGCFYLHKDFVQEIVSSSNISPKNLLREAIKISTSRGYSSIQATDGTIWTDVTGQGLLSYQEGRTTYWKDQSNVFKVHVNDMAELPDSTLVFATHGEGLILMKNGDYWVINEVEHLPSNIVNALYINDNQLWVATNRGVALLEDIDLPRRKFKINVYNRNDGLITEDIADLLIWKNQLMLGTQLGLVSVPLNKERSAEVSPRIILNHVEVNGERFALDQIEAFSHAQNSLQFHFLGVSFRSKGKLRYRYRLTGYDQDWVSTSNREITYHNLSPGNYTFEVSAVDYKGQISANPASISFQITPHFTQRAIFWILIVLLGIALLFGAIQSYLSIRERNVLSKLVEEKTAILDRKIQQLARSNEELEEFARAASHDLKSPLRNVASFIQLLDRKAKQRLQTEEREYIDLAVRGVKGMERTIDDLLKITRVDQLNEEREVLNFADVVEEIKLANQNLIEEHGAKIVLETSFPNVVFSKVNAYQLFQNLIINGITYRSEDNPVIRLACQDQLRHWIFSVSDNGIGIDPEFQKQIFGLFNRLHHSNEIPGTGIGLTICKKIVERNGGNMTVFSESGKGATFYFSIPKH